MFHCLVLRYRIWNLIILSIVGVILHEKNLFILISSPPAPPTPVVRESRKPGGRLPIKLPICSGLIELGSKPGGKVIPGGNVKPAGSPPAGGAAVDAGAVAVAGGGEAAIPGISAIPIAMSDLGRSKR